MIKELVFKKEDVIYGETGAGANVTEATIASLAEGNIAAFTDDGQLIVRTGTVTTPANVDRTKGVRLYAMENGLLRCIKLVGKGRLENWDDTAAAKVVTFDTDNLPTSRASLKPTGLIVIDSDRNPNDPRARKRAEVPVDDDVDATGASGLAAQLDDLLEEIDGIASASANTSTGVVTITMDAGRNLQFVATGYLEDVSVTVGTALAFGETLSATEMAALEKKVRVHEGRTQQGLNNSDISDMFTKASLVESGLTYTVYMGKYISHPARYVDGAQAEEKILAIATPDDEPGGSDGDGTWAALLDAIFNLENATITA